MSNVKFQMSNLEQNLLAPEEKKTLDSNVEIEKKQSRLPWLIIGGVFIMIIFFIVIPGVLTAQAATKFIKTTNTLQDALRAQDLGAVKTSLEKLDSDLKDIDRSLTLLVWIRPIPWVGGYWGDAKHLVIAARESLAAAQVLIPAIEPYADILGFGKGVQTTDGAKTAEERIDFVVSSLPAVLPKLDAVAVHLKVAEDSINQVDPSRYPQNFRGTNIRAGIVEFINFTNDATTLLVDGKPLLTRLPYLMGIDREKTYLVIFQNDKELRPTGGFMTAYSLMRVKNGEIQPVRSDDIYNLDSRYKANLEAPPPIVRYLGGPKNIPYTYSNKWRLRDMNWTPDFKVAMELFSKEAQSAGIKEIDGVIAVDTEVLVGLLTVTGKIGVPGFGNYSAQVDSRCNCPQVIYELESYADIEGPVVWDPVSGKIVYGRLLDNRKAIVGPLVNSVLANILAQPKDKLPQVFRVMLEAVSGKHVLFYVFDEETQKAIETFNAGGRIKDVAGDYLAIVDANLGGRKSNLYIQQEVVDKISKKGNKVVHELEITYKNPQRHDGWLNSVQRDYMRVYVKRGAKLIKSSGLADEGAYEDLGKTFFAGFWELRPLGIVKISLVYEVPLNEREYTLLIQKQAGTPTPQYAIHVGRETQEFLLKSDKQLRFKL